MKPPAYDLDDQAYIVAQLEGLLSEVRAGRVPSIVCVSVGTDGSYHPWWATSDGSLHAGAVLRAAAAYLVARMDATAIAAGLADERERDPNLS